MELDELHVTCFRPCTKGHCHAVSRCHWRICSVAIKLSHTSCSQQHCRSRNCAGLALFGNQIYATNPVISNQQDGGKLKFTYRNAGQSFSFGVERAENFPSSGITVSMKNAIAAVRSFTSKRQMDAVSVKL